MEAINNIRRSRAFQGIKLLNDPTKKEWPCPEDSTGDIIASIGRQSCYEAIGPARTVFLAISPDIKEFLDRNIEPTPYWVTWSMYMVGKQPNTAVPTIVFCCENEAHRKKIRNAVRDSGLLERYPAGIALKHLPRAPDHKQLIQLASIGAAGDDRITGFDLEHRRLPGVYSTVQRPNYGDALYIETGLGCGPRRATAGGMIWYMGLDYLTTAAHAFEKAQLEPSNVGVQDENLYFSDSDEESDLLSLASRSSDDLLSYSSAQSLASTDLETGLETNRSASAQSIQPVLQPSKPPSDSRRGDDSVLIPADAFLIGHILFSSVKNSEPELDYALIQLTVNRYPGHYGALKFPRHTKEDAFPRISHPSVQVHTASSGTINGTLQLTPIFLRPPHAKKYQQVYPIHLAAPLTTGDCGSCAFSRSAPNHLHGHIVAGSPETRVAFLVPACHVFADMTLRLPSIEAGIKSRYANQRFWIDEPRARVRVDGYGASIAGMHGGWSTQLSVRCGADGRGS